MANKRTLGGMDCPARCAVWPDQCQKCKKHRLCINDQVIYDACKCLKPQWSLGQAIVVDTSDVVDALGIQWDDQLTPSPGTTAKSSS